MTFTPKQIKIEIVGVSNDAKRGRCKGKRCDIVTWYFKVCLIKALVFMPFCI